MKTTADRASEPPAPRWLDDTEMAAWRGYIESLASLSVALEVDLAPHGLTMGDYEVLVVLSESEGRQMRMCDLAARLRLSPSGLTRRLDGLVHGHLVRREPSPSDRRVMLATLTDDGLGTLTIAAPGHVEAVRRHFLDHLTAAEVRAMATGFGKVRSALACPTTAVTPAVSPAASDDDTRGRKSA